MVAFIPDLNSVFKDSEEATDREVIDVTQREMSEVAEGGGRVTTEGI